MEYDLVNSFLISNSITGHEFKRWLFFDIHTNGQYLTLISTFYPDIAINFKNEVIIHQKINNRWGRLPLFQELRRNRYEPIRVVKYKMNSSEDSNYFKVNFRDQEQTFILKKDECPKKTNALATLFLQDSYRIDRWLDYHRLKGFSHFYLFYNGRIPENIRKPLSLMSDVTVGEWNFPYWTDGNVISPNGSPSREWKTKILRFVPKDLWHHAQTAFLNNILTKYGHRHEWIGMIDLDEMIVSSPNTKIDFNQIPTKIAAILMPCYWTLDQDPATGKVLKNNEHCGSRTKYLIRPDKALMIKVHEPYKVKGKIIPYHKSGLSIFHLIDSNNSHRTSLVENPIEDSLQIT